MQAINRRKFLGSSIVAGGLFGATAAMPAWARGGNMNGATIRQGFDEVSGRNIDLTIARGPRIVQGRSGMGVAVNGSVPGPLVRLKEGDPVNLNVTNKKRTAVMYSNYFVHLKYSKIY